MGDNLNELILEAGDVSGRFKITQNNNTGNIWVFNTVGAVYWDSKVPAKLRDRWDVRNTNPHDIYLDIKGSINGLHPSGDSGYTYRGTKFERSNDSHIFECKGYTFEQAEVLSHDIGKCIGQGLAEKMGVGFFDGTRYRNEGVAPGADAIALYNIWKIFPKGNKEQAVF